MFDVNIPNSKQDTAIWKCQNLQRNVWPSGMCGRCFRTHNFFVNFDIFKCMCVAILLLRRIKEAQKTPGFEAEQEKERNIR